MCSGERKRESAFLRASFSGRRVVDDESSDIQRAFSGPRGEKIVVAAAFVWTTATFLGVDSSACA